MPTGPADTQLYKQAIAVLALIPGNTARHAANVLRGDRIGGRPRTDDTAAIAAMARLHDCGRGREAAAIVARSIANDPSDTKEIASISHRLRKRWRTENRTNGV